MRRRLHDFFEHRLAAGDRSEEGTVLRWLPDALLLLDDPIELEVHFSARREYRLNHAFGERLTRLNGGEETGRTTEDAVDKGGLAGLPVEHHRRGVEVVERAEPSGPVPSPVQRTVACLEAFHRGHL